MDNKQVTAEWIAQQRAVSDTANERLYSEASENAKSTIICSAFDAALDALEASMQREAEKEKQCGIWRKASERLADHEKDLQQTIARLTAERDAAVCDMFGCMSTQGQCVRCKKRYYCDGTDDDKFSPSCKNNSHCYAWEWRGLHADNTDAPTGAESE